MLETVVMTSLTPQYLDVKYVSRGIQTFIVSLILLFATCHPCGIKEADTPDLYQALNEFVFIHVFNSFILIFLLP